MPAAEPIESRSATVVVERMQADLKAAMKERDRVAIGALRTGLAAVANAEAPPALPTSSADEPVVGRLVEHARLKLTVDDVDRILRHEIADREHTIDAIAPHGRDEEISVLRNEIAVLQRYIA